MIRSNFWSGLATALFAVVLLAWVIPIYGGSGFAIGIQPQRLATLGAWLILGCALALTLLSALQARRAGEPLIKLPRAGDTWHMLWPFLYVLGFIVLIDRFPLTWVAPFLIGLLLMILGERRWYVVGLVSAVPTAGLYVLTVHLMRIGVV